MRMEMGSDLSRQDPEHCIWLFKFRIKIENCDRDELKFRSAPETVKVQASINPCDRKSHFTIEMQIECSNPPTQSWLTKQSSVFWIIYELYGSGDRLALFNGTATVLLTNYKFFNFYGLFAMISCCDHHNPWLIVEVEWNLTRQLATLNIFEPLYGFSFIESENRRNEISNSFISRNWYSHWAREGTAQKGFKEESNKVGLLWH